MARLLRGFTISVDGYAINDFQEFTVGVITNLNFGVLTSGGLTWGDSVVIVRTGS